MDHSCSPPSPTWLPSARPQGTPKFSTSFRRFSPSRTTSYSTRSHPGSMLISSNTHLLQDLEPRTYDSPSDAESVPSEYKDSPPTPTGTVAGRKGKGLSQLTPRGGMSIPTRNITPRSKPRWQRMQQLHAYSDHNSEGEQHGFDLTPQPVSRKTVQAEDELPRWARSTDSGRINRIEEDEMQKSMQSEWVRSSTVPQPPEKNEVRFKIPPPITASLMLATTSDGGRNGERGQRREQSILSSILGAFPSPSRQDRSSENSTGRNRTSHLGEEWADIMRQERVLQGRIQELLDLQASGLQRSSDGGAAHEKGSRSPARARSDMSESSMKSVSLWSSTTLRGRDHQNGKRALHTARMELLKAMYMLNDLAVAKQVVLAETSKMLEIAHKQLVAWERKLQVADENLRQLDEHDSHNDEGDLQRQIRNVEIDVEELERKLKEKKEERRRLLKRRTEYRSVKEAEAAKWVELKREVDRDVGRWLRDPNVPSDMLESNEHWAEFMKLNPQRRNFEVAVEGLGGAIKGIKKRIAGSQIELDACERGTKLWSECLEQIMKSEKALKDFLQRSLSSKEGLGQEMLGVMEDTEGKLEEQFLIAEKERWNLVMCVLGAEVEAWREGVDMLKQMAGTSSKPRKRAVRQEEKDDLRPDTTASYSDPEDINRRRHSSNTDGTEDPMWGSGLDNDAQILESPSAALSSNFEELRKLQGDNIPSLTPTIERRPSKGSDSSDHDHIIHTEGLKISPSRSSWLDSSPQKDTGSSSPEREVSFRTAMEDSAQVEADSVDEGFDGRKTLEKETAEKGDVEEEVMTQKEQRVAPHLKKGGKVDGEGEKSDGEVPADLLS